MVLPESPSGGAPVHTSAQAVFEARGVTKVYHMGEIDVHALRGVDLDLYARELVVMLGPSGSGELPLLKSPIHYCAQGGVLGRAIHEVLEVGSQPCH